MTDKKLSTPAKVNADVLRKHFKSNYDLEGDQVDLMLESSSQSLKKSLAGLYEALDQENNLEELAKLGHNVKGVLLNMGELEWAEVAKKIELAAAAGKKTNYRSMVEHIHEGVKGVL